MDDSAIRTFHPFSACAGRTTSPQATLCTPRVVSTVVHDCQEQRVSARGGRAAGERLMARTILVVDDHPATSSLIQRTLTQQGYTVSTVADGAAALVAAATQHPDLVIADVYLPGLDGLAVIHTLRQQDPRLSVIAMSAAPEVLGQLESAPAGLDLGPIAFLAKPFSLVTLIALVQSVMPLINPS